MKTRVCTLMWGTAWERYGAKFASSFARYWPETAELYIVTDQRRHIPRAVQIPLEETPGYAAFMATWKGNRKAEGFDSGHRKQDGYGRSWRHDAIKWAPQGLAPRACLDGLSDGDFFVWLDADVETVADVPEGWVSLLMAGQDVACLQRAQQHSEIGFWAVRVSAATRRFVDLFGDYYASGRVFALPEYHSAFVWDETLRQFHRLNIRNLNPSKTRGHCWPVTALASYTRHNKGKLKDA